MLVLIERDKIQELWNSSECANTKYHLFVAMDMYEIYIITRFKNKTTMLSLYEILNPSRVMNFKIINFQIYVHEFVLFVINKLKYWTFVYMKV